MIRGGKGLVSEGRETLAPHAAVFAESRRCARDERLLLAGTSGNSFVEPDQHELTVAVAFDR
jgi:hypothetical protein